MFSTLAILYILLSWNNTSTELSPLSGDRYAWEISLCGDMSETNRIVFSPCMQEKFAAASSLLIAIFLAWHALKFPASKAGASSITCRQRRRPLSKDACNFSVPPVYRTVLTRSCKHIVGALAKKSMKRPNHSKSPRGEPGEFQMRHRRSLAALTYTSLDATTPYAFLQGYNLFCVNGVTFPDRTPHPALWEAKFLAQPVGIELLDCSSSTTAPGNFSFARNFFAGGSFPASLLSTTLKNDEKAGSGGWRGNKKGLPAAVDDISLTMADAAARGVTGTSLSVRVTNRYDFLWLDHLSAVWKLQSSSECSESSFLPASGSFSLEGIAPGDCHDVELSVGEDGRSKADSGTGEMAPWGVGEIFLQVEVRLRSDTPWAQAGHLVAWGSFPVASAVARPATATGDMLSCESSCVAAHEASAMGDVTQVPVGGDVLGGMAAVQRPLTSSALIVYDDEDGESVSSPEGSPMGQL